MNIELLTKSDLADLTNVLLQLQQEVKAVHAFMDRSKLKLIGAAEIRARLGNISYSTFVNRRPKLIAFGMFNDGKWKMKIADLDRYIESEKNG